MSTTDEIQQQLQDAIDNAKNNPLADSDQQTGMQTLTSKIKDGNQDVLDEIKKLAQATFDIEQAFNDVSTIFRKIQLGNASQGLKDDVQSLTNKWNEHHNTYVQLLWDSRQVAGSAEAAADDFAGDFATFLGEVDVPIDEKKQEITNYINKLTADEKEAADMSQGFSDLQKNIGLFKQDWQKIVDSYSLDDMNAQAAQLEEDLKSLNETLNQLASKLETLTNVMIGLGVVAGASLALGFVCPFFWIATLVAVLAMFTDRTLMLSTQSAYDQTAAEIEDKKKQLATLMADMAAVQELRAGLEDSARSFDTIMTKLTVFANVWAMLRTDIQEIANELEFANSSATWLTMHDRLNTAAAMYSALGNALRQYQISVNPDNQVFVSRGFALPTSE
ncbi:hypothetical protein K474DRAFT_1769049 [Panus rudis PR-1116 ss-1]|nr:hypothetical protein K474DRAFT_1769049 [Panus rudis PR-1116 ss-1]